jgi:trans-aconitate methyltransferase
MSLGGMIRNTVDTFSLSYFMRMCLFRWNVLRYQLSNNRFKKNNPWFPMPPDSLLFETGSLHYHSYQNSGQEAAAEIVSLCKVFSNSPIQSILDWGCGVGRVTRHLPTHFPNANIVGADANPDCIQWLQNNIPEIQWIQSNAADRGETLFGKYDLIIALSVLTHLPASEQANWLNILHSLLNPQGLVWLSTHGKTYLHQITHQQKKQLSEQGILTLGADKKGSRQMRTYHSYSGMKQLLGQDWEIVMYYDGQKFPGILGGQDAWLLKKLR